MKLKKNYSLKTLGFIKKTIIILISSGLFLACNDANKKAEEGEIEIDPLEVEEDTMSNYSYESNAVADYLIYIDGEDEYSEMQEEIDPEIALQKFAAAISERRQAFGMEADQQLEVIGDTLSNSIDGMNEQLETALASFEKLQENSYEELSEEVDELKAELQGIDMQENDAKEKLKSFFNKAADVIEEMDAPTSDGTMSVNPGELDKSDYSQEPDTLEVDR